LKKHFRGLVTNCNYFKIGRGNRGDVTILPTLVINNAQYRGLVLDIFSVSLSLYEDAEVSVVIGCNCEGRLERTAVLKAICAGFNETSEPAICLNTGLETNECLENNGGCWQDTKANITACQVCRKTELTTSHLTTILNISINLFGIVLKTRENVKI